MRKMNKTHLTAITRNKASSPARWLWKNEFINSNKVLDYGCGKSMDHMLVGGDKYDPYYHPKKPRKKYDIILCTYVLNVIPEKERKETLDKIKKLLTKKGKAYITVRRDLSKSGHKSPFCYQSYVKLNRPSIFKNSNYCIYEMESS